MASAARREAEARARAIGAWAIGALLQACSPASSHAEEAPAGPPATVEGVWGYRVHVAGPHDLDVSLVGSREGRIVVHATESQSVQRLQMGDHAVEWRTSADRIEVVRGGVVTALAEYDGERWLPRESITAAEGASLRTLAAVDVDLSMQGTSIVGGGAQYVPCTVACLAATSCLPREAERVSAACAPHLVTCGACLEAEP